MRWKTIAIATVLFLSSGFTESGADMVLIEAESFADRGGWVVQRVRIARALCQECIRLDVQTHRLVGSVAKLAFHTANCRWSEEWSTACILSVVATHGQHAPPRAADTRNSW